ARRRRDRVRAPPARRAARHRPGGAARVARAGGDPVAVRPHPRHLRGPDRGRVPAERDGGGARVRDDGRPAGGCSGMTDESLLAEEAAAAPPPETPQPSQSFPSRFGGLTGAIGPVITTLIAFLMGGLVVLATGKNPFKVYHAIFNGTGLNWFFHVGNHTARIPFTTHKVWFPWDTASVAAQNLQQTLLLTTPIILTALADAFAFRCGMFNIGRQGQYFAGTIFAVWLGSSFASLSPFLHVTLCLIVGALAGAAYAGIAGILKATVGAHEVISTIMLNWILVWVGW